MIQIWSQMDLHIQTHLKAPRASDTMSGYIREIDKIRALLMSAAAKRYPYVKHVTYSSKKDNNKDIKKKAEATPAKPFKKFQFDNKKTSGNRSYDREDRNQYKTDKVHLADEEDGNATETASDNQSLIPMMRSPISSATPLLRVTDTIARSHPSLRHDGTPGGVNPASGPNQKRLSSSP